MIIRLCIIFQILGMLYLKNSNAGGISTPPNHQIIVQNQQGLKQIENRLIRERRIQKQSKIVEQNVLYRLRMMDHRMVQTFRDEQQNQSKLYWLRMNEKKLEHQVQQCQTKLEQDRRILKDRIRGLQKLSDDNNLIVALLSAKNFSDLARTFKFNMLLAQSDAKVIRQTLTQRTRLQESLADLTSEKSQEIQVVQALSWQKKQFEDQRNQKISLLEEIRRRQDIRRQLIVDLSKDAENLKKKIDYFLNQSPRNVPWLNQSLKKQFQAGLLGQKGRLPWPTIGKIISPFGIYENHEFNAIVKNDGIQIAAPWGTPFRAIAAGKVLYANWFKGYGELVIIDHGQGYYSIYGQAAGLSVSKGMWVQQGQVLGVVGNSGSLVGNSLYFEIRKDGIPLDPLHWLK